jgi:hypothetical protein
VPSNPPPLLSPRPSLVNWPPIVAAASMSFALLVSVVAWIVTHPRHTTEVAAPVANLTSAAPEEVQSAPPAPLPVAHPAAPLDVTPTFHHPDRREVLVKNLPLVDEAPPLLPPIEPPPAKKEPIAAASLPAPAGETYGTQVLFLNNPAAAAALAKHDKKLMFVMHISGNFEESCFT